MLEVSLDKQFADNAVNRSYRNEPRFHVDPEMGEKLSFFYCFSFKKLEFVLKCVMHQQYV